MEMKDIFTLACSVVALLLSTSSLVVYIRSAKRTLNASICPVIEVNVFDSPLRRITAKNVGRGHAYDLVFEVKFRPSNESQKTEPFEYRMVSLGVDDEKDLVVGISDEFSNGIEVKVTCKNILGEEQPERTHIWDKNKRISRMFPE